MPSRFLRNVEDLSRESGIDVMPETVRFWCHRFGTIFAVEATPAMILGCLTTPPFLSPRLFLI
jgi:hypothetical protein